jgi:tetratricopeptide (TPR) repeat protein
MRRMNQVACQECSRSLSTSEAYELNGKVYCGPCLQSAAQRAKEAGQPVKVTRYVDKSICARCNTYIGEGGGVEVGTVRLCLNCSTLVQDWPYPQWLKLSLAGLLLLLVFALFHGRKFFQAGKDLYRGEQLVELGRYAEALPYLKGALKIAPNSDKGALLTAKAALLSGDPQTAAQALQGHEGGRFEKGDTAEFQEVNNLWKRATSALDDLEKAAKLEEQDGNEVEAAKLAHHAAALYPQLQYIDIVVDQYDEGVAFVNNDYDTYLNLAEKDWKLMPSSNTASMLSSALACKYAISGDAALRQRSEEMLAKSKELAKGKKQILDKLAEFEERNRYRLETRQLINKSEYDRKFRSGKTAQ